MRHALSIRFLAKFIYLMAFSCGTALAAGKSDEVSIKGKLEAYIIDKHDGTHKEVIYIKEAATERRYEILNAKMPHQGLLDAKSVVVKGKKKNAEQLESADIAFDGYTGTTSFGTAAPPKSSGVQDVLVYLVNFQDFPEDKPWTVQEVNDVVFNQINSFYLENSMNRTSLKGQVAGWYTIPVNSTSCDGFAIEVQAKTMAKAAGFVLENYGRHVYIFPKNSACGYSGMGQVAANPSSAWINNNITIRTIAHELGHNLGAYHAHAWECPGSPVPLSGMTCTKQDYGNTVDIMGYTGTVGHFNAFEKDRFGWLTSTDLIDASAGGTFTIAPYALSSGQARALKVYRGLSSTGVAEWFYLEYRQPIGFDSMISNRGAIVPANIFGGLTISLASPMDGNSSFHLDMTPDSTFLDLGDAALLPGKVFSDPVSGLSFETISASSSGLTVKISKGTGSGSTPTPTPSPTPKVALSSTSLAFGNQLLNTNSIVRTVTVSNTGSATLNISAKTVTADYYLSGGTCSTSLSAGASCTIGVYFRPSITGTRNGTLTITTNAANSPHVVALSGYGVAPTPTPTPSPTPSPTPVSDITKPVVTISSPSNGAVFSPRSTVTIRGSASDNVRVARVEVWVNGSLRCSGASTSYSCSYLLSNAKGVSYKVEVRAYDSSNNLASVAISIWSSSTQRK